MKKPLAHSSFLFTLLLLVSLFSCSKAKKGHDHSNANEFMNDRQFEKLVARFEDPERAGWQKREEVIALMGDLQGKVVAEIGAGSGYFSIPLSTKAGKVIALDIDQRFLDYIENKADSLNCCENLETRMTPETEANLKAGEADWVININTYHHIEGREAYFADLHQKLAGKGKLMIIDFYKKKLPVGPPKKWKIDQKTVKKELEAAGYQSVEINTELLPYQYVIIAK